VLKIVLSYSRHTSEYFGTQYVVAHLAGFKAFLVSLFLSRECFKIFQGPHNIEVKCRSNARSSRENIATFFPTSTTKWFARIFCWYAVHVM